MQESEYFSNNSDDCVDSFDQLNKPIELDPLVDECSQEISPVEAFQRLLTPSNSDLETVWTEHEYKDRQTDPYLRILNIKDELVLTKKLLDEHAEMFKDNVFVTETDNLSFILQELDLYKSKIDAFINYDLFNKIDKEQTSDDEENSQEQKSQSSASLNNTMVAKNEFFSLFGKYDRITENLISHIKSTQNDIINENFQKFNIKYEIVANPEMVMDNLLNKITELEDKINHLEKTIGNWKIYNNNESISLILMKLLNFTTAKMNEKYDKKYQTFKECGNLIASFLDKKKEKLENGSYFLKIKELYAILELCEHFDQIFDYIRNRLKAIKQIYDNSDQFTNLLQNLTKTIVENEEKLNLLLTEYEETLKCFGEFDNVLTEISQIDNIIKEKLII